MREPTPENIRALAANAKLAARATTRVAELLNADSVPHRRAAIAFFTRQPVLARAHTRALSERLIDEDLDVQDAAYEPFKAQPELLDLPAETLADWLQSNDWEKRLGAVRAAALDPALARPHARTLSERLGDGHPDIGKFMGYQISDVGSAAYALFKAQPELLDSSLVAQALLSPDPDRRQRTLNLAHPLDTSDPSGSMPLLEGLPPKDRPLR